MEWKICKLLCGSTLFEDMGWYLGVIGKLQNGECLIYIFMGEVLNGTPNILNKSSYHCWYKQLDRKLSLVLINTTH